MLLDVASWVTDRLTVAFAGPSYFDLKNPGDL